MVRLMIPDKLECWILAIGFGCWRRLRILEQVKVLEQVSFDKQVLIIGLVFTIYLEIWCILWYWCTQQTWMLIILAIGFGCWVRCRFPSSSKQVWLLEENAVLTNFHGSCNFNLWIWNIFRLALDTESAFFFY